MKLFLAHACLSLVSPAVYALEFYALRRLHPRFLRKVAAGEIGRDQAVTAMSNGLKMASQVREMADHTGDLHAGISASFTRIADKMDLEISMLRAIAYPDRAVQ